MSFYVEKVKRKKSWRYRIVEDSTQGGVRKRKYNILPEKTTKAQERYWNIARKLKITENEKYTL